MKKILITGTNSYIGKNVDNWLQKYPNKYKIESISLKEPNWVSFDFSSFDVIFHVAGIAHDMGRKKDADLYYKVNRDLALETAIKAKNEGVKQFIFMSSILIYNGCKDRIISKDTIPKSKGFYSDSKLQADVKLQELNDENFKVAIIRPPMIFGPNCKGNFPRLAKLALKIPIFPNYNNLRSMLYIDNLCEFIKLLIDSEKGGVFFPQNHDYYSTTEIVKNIAIIKNKKIYFTRLANWLIKLFKRFLRPIEKMFGDLIYDKSISNHFNYKYIVTNNYQSINNYINKSNI